MSNDASAAASHASLASSASNPWYFEYLDQIANLELKNKPAQQGGTAIRYREARAAQGGGPICTQVAHVLQSVQAGATVILATGTGNPEWLPRGETDGPSGVAILARVFGALGVRSCILSEARFLPGIAASVRAGGTPLLDEAAWRRRDNAALVLPFPTGAAAAGPFIDGLMERLPSLAAGFFIEKPGPNALGVFHNSSGKPKDSEWVAHAHLLVPALHARGLPTVAVGDGGNEIGFGRIRARLAPQLRGGGACACPCDGGLLDATEVGLLLPAAVSNWGAYAIAAALALVHERPGLLPDWPEVAASISAPLAEGAFDGYSGLALDTVDGTSRAANQAIYQLMQEVLRLAQAQ
ncbi:MULTISPECIES: glutamate cyclase domain-containing protein [unclassified Achromobacter]|uniref:glutamate cyclase domain-containing protein n=1 Tax=unclassified Achromobacter TaxID=2626865 RepID=UPI001303877B|nr:MULTISPECIES: glutamate cyclase domain-containing protein [unclassified Achromobacter]